MQPLDKVPNPIICIIHTVYRVHFYANSFVICQFQAIAATESMTDRYCTLSKHQNSYVNISTEDVISCCGLSCGTG